MAVTRGAGRQDAAGPAESTGSAAGNRPAAVIPFDRAEIPDAEAADAGCASTPLQRRIAALTRMLDARDRTIDLLIRRLNGERKLEDATLHALEDHRNLESAVSRKTAEAEREHRRFLETLDKLHLAQARLLQAQKMISIGQLAAGIAHELNTPIQYVADNVMFLDRAFESLCRALDRAEAIVETAKSGPVPADLLVAFEHACREGDIAFVREDLPDAIAQSRDGLKRIAAIVGAMKKFSHPSNDVSAPADLADIVETTIVVARNEWKYVADVETDFDADLPEVPCVRDDIGKVVLNLVVNAAHAIAEAIGPERARKGTIRISTRKLGEWAEIRIADSGPGIPEAIRGRVFDPFFTTKAVGVGTGQGLAIAHAIVVDQHHGQLFFETRAGEGTTFHVRLPLVAEAP